MTSPPRNRIEATLGGARDWIDAQSPGRFFLLALLPLLAIYLATASWSSVKSPDPLTNSVTAWKLVEDRTVFLDDYAAWSGIRTGPILVVEGDGRPVSQFPPGAALLAAPLYAVWPGQAEV